MYKNEIQGAQGELDAMAIMSKACEVLTPSTFRHAAYDFVFINFTNQAFEKVQVKSCRTTANGRNRISLTNDKGKHYSSLNVDYMFCVLYDFYGKNRFWLIPTKHVSDKKEISITSSAYDVYEIDTTSTSTIYKCLEAIIQTPKNSQPMIRAKVMTSSELKEVAEMKRIGNCRVYGVR